ncbi:MAG TPA: 4Fe-4S binding protein [Bacteroidota bacterium]|jgi:ferredoxin|nr:4Fe-4S binding protein [Bacteroidota bacterium]
MIVITDDCINCNACIDECPSNAIYAAGESYVVNGETRAPMSEDITFSVPELCTMCEGYSDSPSCIDVCPSDAIINQ